jgi:hypothetical protein
MLTHACVLIYAHLSLVLEALYCVPEVKVTDSPCFGVCALYLQEAVDIVQRHLPKGCHLACQELIETAAARWQDEEGDYRDDVSGCLCTEYVAFCPLDCL